MALDISVCYLSNLDKPTVAQGWIARAHSAAALSGDERLDGWLWLMEGYTCDEPARQRKLLGRALDLARRLGDPDLELSALTDLGLAMVTSGDVSAGLALLDEAMAGTLAGECVRLDTVVWASCSMLSACSLVADHARAAQWCAAADSFAVKYGCPFLHARCRAHYGRVLVGTGTGPLRRPSCFAPYPWPLILAAGRALKRLVASPSCGFGGAQSRRLANFWRRPGTPRERRGLCRSHDRRRASKSGHRPASVPASHDRHRRRRVPNPGRRSGRGLSGER